jgi:hypothetical protein
MGRKKLHSRGALRAKRELEDLEDSPRAPMKHYDDDYDYMDDFIVYSDDETAQKKKKQRGQFKQPWLTIEVVLAANSVEL